MKAIVETTEITDEGYIIATRLSDGYYLFVSDYDNITYGVHPSIVEFI